MSIRVVIVACCLLAATAQRGYYQQQPPEPEKLKIDPYTILGLPKDPTPAQIKKAYRTAALKFHPDKYKAADAGERMAEVSQAYEMIGDPDQKTIYDEFGNSQKFYNKWQYEMDQKKKGKKASKSDFYTHSDDVQNLKQATFDTFVQDGKVMVEFYAPWCVHCQDMVGEYKKLGVLLDESVKLGALNCDSNQRACNQQGVHGYPTLRLYLPADEQGEVEQEEYQGGHTAGDMYSWVQQSLNNDLVSLSESNFDEQVTNSDDIWLIDFSAGQWCGPCTQLKGSMRNFASKLKSTTKVGIVNCDNEKGLCERMEVAFFPQIRLFKRGRTDASGKLLDTGNSHFPAITILNIYESLVEVFVDAKPEEAAPEVDSSSIDEEEEDEDARMDREAEEQETKEKGEAEKEAKDEL